jgi:hypothetical protein
MKSLSLPYEPNSERQPSELKKVLVGLVYTFIVEIISFLVAVLCILVMWYLFFYCLGRSDYQSHYVYHPYEIKYLLITIGGFKKRVAVKKYLKKYKIICH